MSVPVCPRWGGVAELGDALGPFGFSRSFCAKLAKLCAANPAGVGDRSGLFTGAVAALPDSPEDAPLVSTVRGTAHRCVSFLAADGSAATRLRTSLFACGPVAQPVTIFLVGIALEDGCFLSGIRGRFELGCLYPGTQTEALMDKSAVKMCASSNTVRGELGRLKIAETSSDDDSSDVSDRSDGSLPPAAGVVAGTTGPGRWHVYACVYDGETSERRVDGVEETQGGGLRQGRHGRPQPRRGPPVR
jgi:hypothetical protein